MPVPTGITPHVLRLLVLLLVLLATEHLVEEAELGDAGDNEEAEDQHEEVEESHSEYLVEFCALVSCWRAECRCRGGMESCVRSRLFVAA